MFLTFIFISVVIYLVEGIPLVKKKMWKELTTAIVIIIIAVSLAVLRAVGITSPIKVLVNLLIPFGKAIFRNH